MNATKAERSLSRPRHHVTGEDYPGEWARRIELYLDEEQRRIVFYAGLFGGFVLCVVAVLVIQVAA